MGSGRELLESVSDAVKIARALRFEDPETFDDVTPAELETVARGLRAVAYSCHEGARLLDRVAKARSGSGHEVPIAGARTAAEILEENRS